MDLSGWQRMFTHSWFNWSSFISQTSESLIVRLGDGWGFTPQQPTIRAPGLSFWERRWYKKCCGWDWPENNPASSCQPNPANEFYLTVPRVAMWQHGTDRVGSGDREAVRCHLLYHWCTPLNLRLRTDGEGGYKDRLLWVVHNKKGSSCRTWYFSCAQDPCELWCAMTARTAGDFSSDLIHHAGCL